MARHWVMFDLPEHLSERCRMVNAIDQLRMSGPIVVWLKSSLRTHENPALDAGRILAERHNLPLLVYQGIDERYPHANARHHNILLDAAVDLHQGCKQLGLDYSLHVARKGHRPPVMKEFGEIASMIITDLFPLPPWTIWVKSIAASAKCPLLEIDCHCVVPLPVFGKSMDRPFRYRDATKRLRKRRVGTPWPRLEFKNSLQWHGELPFEPVNIMDITDYEKRLKLLQTCNIDMSVHPVWNRRGGERAAIAQWSSIVQME